MGLQNDVRLSLSQGGQLTPLIVISQAISAIVGVSWQDSNWDFSIVSQIIGNLENIGWVIITVLLYCVADIFVLCNVLVHIRNLAWTQVYLMETSNSWPIGLAW